MAWQPGLRAHTAVIRTVVVVFKCLPLSSRLGFDLSVGLAAIANRFSYDPPVMPQRGGGGGHRLSMRARKR